MFSVKTLNFEPAIFHSHRKHRDLALIGKTSQEVETAPKKHLTDLMEECELTLSSGGFLLETDKHTSLAETEMRRCSTLPKCYQEYKSQNAPVDKQQRDDALALQEEDKPQGLSSQLPYVPWASGMFLLDRSCHFLDKKTTHAHSSPLPIFAAALLRRVLLSKLLLHSRVC